MARVVVTGVGVISAIGNNSQENLLGLRVGRTGIGRAQFLRSKYVDSLLFGEVKLTNEALFSLLSLKDTSGITRTELLAIAAFNEAVGASGMTDAELKDPGTALISATTVGGMVETQALFEDAKPDSVASGFQNSYRSGAHTLRMAQIFGLRGYTDTINTACSSSANAIMLGARLIRSGRATRAIVGGVDSLSKYTVNGFNSLQILSDEPTAPFDANRKGLNLGEGAAYLVLEREEDAKKNLILGEIRGYGNRNDAHHPSAMSPGATGVLGAIGDALKTAGLEASEISHINAHGTGTENNDHTELLGFHRIFDTVPPYISTKSYTGHTLASSGAIEAVFSLFSIAHNEIYPSLNFSTPMEEFDSRPQTEFMDNVEIYHVLSNSFGFGGNCSSLILSKV